ncbi:TPA: type 1 fimbrial protein [Citrobacter werkmanii]|nr:type 1 fimbrial protein [Citrobacter werkmanii]
MKKTMMAGALAASVMVFGAHADMGGGVVNFKGKVVDASCGIAPESADQSVDFGQISKAHLATEGAISARKSLNIKLTNCDIKNTSKGVEVTFSGTTVTGAPTELATSGTSNVAVVINAYGSDVTYGTATPVLPLVNGENTLTFQTWAKQAKGKTVAEGEFSAVANFSMAYN